MPSALPRSRSANSWSYGYKKTRPAHAPSGNAMGSSTCATNTGLKAAWRFTSKNFSPSIPMVRMPGKDRLRAIDLFGQQHAHHKVRPCQRPQPQLQMRLLQDAFMQPVGPTDDEG